MEASVATRPFARLGQHISHSQVSLFDKCQLAWFFKYIRGITKPPTLPMLLGSCYHAALAYNFTQKMTTGADLSTDTVTNNFVDRLNDCISRGELESVPDNADSYRDAVVRLLQHYYTEHVVGKMEPILVEHEFIRPVPGIDRLFVGIIDVQLSDGRMIDFKLTSRKWSEADIQTNLQSTAYAMLYGYDTDFEFHIGLRANVKPAVQTVKLRRTREDVQGYIQHLRRVDLQMKELECGETEPVPYNGYCNEKMCQYYWECQNWKYRGND